MPDANCWGLFQLWHHKCRKWFSAEREKVSEHALQNDSLKSHACHYLASFFFSVVIWKVGIWSHLVRKLQTLMVMSPPPQWPAFESSSSPDTLIQRGCAACVLPRGKTSTPFGLFGCSWRILLGSPAKLFRWWCVNPRIRCKEITWSPLVKNILISSKLGGEFKGEKS